MAKYERIDGGIRLTTNPVSLYLGGIEVVIESVYTVLEGEGRVITERRILNDLSGESVTFNEYFTGGFGTTEYQADMTSLTLGVDGEEMPYSYHGKRITRENATRAYVNIPDVMTVVEMGGDNDEATVEEGIAFSPVYHLGLSKTISKGAVTTWLSLRKAN